MKASYLIAIASVILAASSAAIAADTKLDGQIFLKAEQVPKSPPFKEKPGESQMGPFGQDSPFQIVTSKTKDPKGDVVFERDIAHWLDPLTLPHSRADCSKWASGHIPFDGDWETCIGWTVRWQFYYNTLKVQIQTNTQKDISGALDNCLGTAVVAGAIAAIVTDGSAAVAAFQSTLAGCLAASIQPISVRVWTEGHWGDWT